MAKCLIEPVNSSGLYRRKWEEEIERTGFKDLIAMGTADMDYKSPGPMLDAMRRVLDAGHLGYPYIKDEFYQAIHDKLITFNDWDIDAEYSVSQNVGIYPSSWALLTALTNPGDRIVILTPVHFCIKRMITLNKRVAIECPLINNNNSYEIDYQSLDAALKSNAKVLWICNPHNPVGRSWKKEELEKLADLALKNNCYIFSDDVYFGLTFPGIPYTPIASIAKEISYKTVTMYSISKSYNATTLKNSFIVAENPEIFKKYNDTIALLNIEYGLNNLAMEAVISAFNECNAWLDSLQHLIKENYELFKNEIQKQSDAIKIASADSTYFAWLDMRDLKLNKKALGYTLENECHVIVENGAELGRGGEGYIRLNLATSKENIIEGAKRISAFANKYI